MHKRKSLSREDRYWRRRAILKWTKVALFILFCGIFSFVGTWTYARSGKFIPTREMLWNTASVRCVDVGQGDATLLLDSGHAVLIDTGTRDYAEHLAAYTHFYAGRIDILFLTHDHADHCGGAEKILTDFRVGTLVIPDAGDWDRIVEVAMENRTRVLRYTPEDAGMTLSAGEITCIVLGPAAFVEDNGNNNSLIVRAELRVDENVCSVLLTGDAEAEEEAAVLAAPYATALRADILKIGHHGSASSTSLPFFYMVDPRVCTISCGNGNEYGHPHNETIALLESTGVPYSRTDLEGTIALDFDGEKITKRKW
ncbi:MAG: MBL fold metallo-hydrolase [Clostridiales bacterium]|nr:MBL fold metallo-hydrolase [Clostridiales bacterium]